MKEETRQHVFLFFQISINRVYMLTGAMYIYLYIYITLTDTASCLLWSELSNRVFAKTSVLTLCVCVWGGASCWMGLNTEQYPPLTPDNP